MTEDQPPNNNSLEDNVTDENGNLKKLVIKTNNGHKTASHVMSTTPSTDDVSSDVKVILMKVDVGKDVEIPPPDDGVGGNPDDNDDVGGVIKIMPLRRSLLPTRKLRPRMRVKTATATTTATTSVVSKRMWQCPEIIQRYGIKNKAAITV